MRCKIGHGQRGVLHNIAFLSNVHSYTMVRKCCAFFACSCGKRQHEERRCTQHRAYACTDHTLIPSTSLMLPFYIHSHMPSTCLHDVIHHGNVAAWEGADMPATFHSEKPLRTRSLATTHPARTRTSRSAVRPSGLAQAFSRRDLFQCEVLLIWHCRLKRPSDSASAYWQ